jgi:hypothetical protein
MNVEAAEYESLISEGDLHLLYYFISPIYLLVMMMIMMMSVGWPL